VRSRHSNTYLYNIPHLRIPPQHERLSSINIIRGEFTGLVHPNSSVEKDAFRRGEWAFGGRWRGRTGGEGGGGGVVSGRAWT
jgi:hypothetical protein